MPTRAERKSIRALHRKKGRRDSGRLLVEGDTCVREVLASGWAVEVVCATEAWTAPPDGGVPVQAVSPSEMAELSALDSPSPVLAVARVPDGAGRDVTRGRWLGLDGIRDPGNLGTILRVADWFGLDGVVCAPDCVDLTNPKTVQASMGSLFRVPAVVADLSDILPLAPWNAGADLEGECLRDVAWPEEGLLVLGSESHGLRPAVRQSLARTLTIPRYGRAESLNVAMAAAVLCAEWRRGG